MKSYCIGLVGLLGCGPKDARKDLDYLFDIENSIVKISRDTNDDGQIDRVEMYYMAETGEFLDKPTKLILEIEDKDQDNVPEWGRFSAYWPVKGPNQYQYKIVRVMDDKNKNNKQDYGEINVYMGVWINGKWVTEEINGDLIIFNKAQDIFFKD